MADRPADDAERFSKKWEHFRIPTPVKRDPFWMPDRPIGTQNREHVNVHVDRVYAAFVVVGIQSLIDAREPQTGERFF